MRIPLILASLLLCALGALPWLAPGRHLLDLASHFILQYALAAALLLLFAIPYLRWRRRPGEGWLAVLPGAALVLNAFWVAPYLPAGGGVAATGAPPLTVMAVNVARTNPRFDGIFRQIRAARPDIVVVVELHPAWAEAFRAFHGDYPHRFELPRDDRFGLGIYSKLPLEGRRVLHVAGAPALVARTSWRGPELRLAALHPPPPVFARPFAIRDAYLVRMAAWARDGAVPALVLGDLNATAYAPALRRFLAASGLFDARRGKGLAPTWPVFLPWPLRIPIDHILADSSLAVGEIRVGKPFGSDHLALTATLAWRR